jgi:WD40 repeat protein
MTATLNGEGRLFCLALAPAGDVLAAGDDQGRVRLWQFGPDETWIDLPALERPGQRAWRLAFSPDGAWLAAGWEDGQVWVYALQSGQALAKLAAHGRPAAALAFSPDGRWLASGGYDARLVWWERATPGSAQP